MRSAAEINSSYGDMYEGGRLGQKMENESYSEIDHEGDGSEREAEAKKAFTKEIKKQFGLRKASTSTKNEDDEDEYQIQASMSRLIAAASTKIKINGLTLKVRDGYVTYLGELLKKNYDACKIIDPPDNPLTDKAIEQASLQLEYQAFSTNKATSLYRRSVAKLMADIKKSTNDVSLYSFLKYLEYDETTETKPSVVKQEEKSVSTQKSAATRPEKQSSSQQLSIVPASQLIGCTSMKPKRESRCIKKETLFQSAMDKYVEKASKSGEAVDEVARNMKQEDETSRSSEEIDADFASVLDQIVSGSDRLKNGEESGPSSSMGFQKSSTLLNSTKLKCEDDGDTPDRFSVSNLRAKYFGFETNPNKNSGNSSSTAVNCEDFVKIKVEPSSTYVNHDGSSPTLTDGCETSIKVEEESSYSSSNDSKTANFSQSITDLNKINALKRKNQGTIYADKIKEERFNCDVKSEPEDRENDYTNENEKLSSDSNEEKIRTTSPIEVISDSEVSVKVEKCSESKDSKASSRSMARRENSKNVEKVENRSSSSPKKIVGIKRKCQDLFGDSDSEGDVDEPGNRIVKISNEDDAITKIVKLPVPKKLKFGIHHKSSHRDSIKSSVDASTINGKNKITPSKSSSKHKHPKDTKQKPTEDSPSKIDASKKEMSDTVIKYLMPFYKEKKILSKDLFKYLARTLVHKALSVKEIKDEKSVKNMVYRVFVTVDQFQTEEEVDKAIKV